MSLVWEQVVVDAADPEGLGRWWAEALGWVVVHDDPEEFEIRPAPDRLPGLLFVSGGGPKAAKNRLHLDFRPDDRDHEVGRLVDLGATRVDIGQGDQSWVVLADPEGNEFCVLGSRRRGEGVLQWTGVCIDCADARELAEFYRDVLGWEITSLEDDWAQVCDPSPGGVHLNIQAEAWYRPPVWPEQPEAQHKMMHLEVETTDVADAVARVVAAGGSEAPMQPADRDPHRLRVVLDPAGHPFCLFVRGE